MRRRYPRRGPKKLLAMGATHASHLGLAEPQHRLGVAEARRPGAGRPVEGRRPGRLPSTLAPITSANATWTTDFKGQFRTGDGQYCYPLTLRDGWSRFVLRCDGLLGADAAWRRSGALPGPLPNMACRIACAVTMAFRSPAPGWRDCRAWRSGGFASGLSLNASHRVARIRMARTSSFMRCSKPTRRARRRRICARNSVASIDFVGNTTTRGRMKRCSSSRPPPFIRRRAAPVRRRLPTLDYPGHMEVRRVSDSGCIGVAERAALSQRNARRRMGRPRGSR